MVFYFSGTGNSQLVAVRIAEMTGDKAVSINRYMKKGEKAVFRSERPLVFVAPVYSWSLPRVVEQWIMAVSYTHLLWMASYISRQAAWQEGTTKESRKLSGICSYRSLQ